MHRTPQFMRNYLANYEEINVEIDSWFIRSCMTSSVLFPIRWVAPSPQFFKICFLQLLQLDILQDFDFCPQQHSPIVFVLQDLCLQLGECDRTLLSVLTYLVLLSEVCVHLKLRSFTSWRFNLIIPKVSCPRFPQTEASTWRPIHRAVMILSQFTPIQ